MKTALKILTALAAAIGAVYVIATYGEKIVAWAKSMLPCCQEVEVVEEEVAAEVAAEEAPAEEPVVEEAPVEENEVEIVVEDNEPVAEEADFEA